MRYAGGAGKSLQHKLLVSVLIFVLESCIRRIAESSRGFGKWHLSVSRCKLCSFTQSTLALPQYVNTSVCI